MISSARRLKVLLDLLTKASITLSSMPESASEIMSATGAVTLRLGGAVFPAETGRTAAFEISSRGAFSGARASTSAGLSRALSESVAALIAGASFSVELEASCTQPPTNGSVRANPRVHVQRVRFFIFDPKQPGLVKVTVPHLTRLSQGLFIRAPAAGRSAPVPGRSNGRTLS